MSSHTHPFPTTPNPRGGPRTEAGKAASSRNAVTHGLFSHENLILPGEETNASELSESLCMELVPQGALELNLAGEIYRALWRLRRCALIEERIAALLPPDADPLEHDSTIDSQLSVDRARNQAHRLLCKSMAELRRLQTERQFRRECSSPTPDPTPLGLCDSAQLRRDIDARAKYFHREKEQNLRAEFESFRAAKVAEQQRSSFCKSAMGTKTTPRNADCPCKSGLKYKRCCGKDAPAILQAA